MRPGRERTFLRGNRRIDGWVRLVATKGLLAGVLLSAGSGVEAVTCADYSLSPEFVGSFPIQGDAIDIKFVGTTMIVLETFLPPKPPPTLRLTFYDASDPLVPSVLSSIYIGDYAQVTTSLEANSSLAVVQGVDNGPYFVDWRDRLHPVILPSDFRSTSAVAFDGNLMYFCSPSSGFLVVDVSNPIVPIPLGSTAVPSLCDVVGFENGFVYAAGRGLEGDIHVFNVSDPTHPFLANTIPTERLGAAGVGGARLCVHEWQANEIHVFDVSDPTQLRPLEGIEFPAYFGLARILPRAGRVYIVGMYYEPSGWEGYSNPYGKLHSVDVEDPENPKYLGIFPHLVSARCVARHAGWNFVGDAQAIRAYSSGDDPAHFDLGNVDLPNSRGVTVETFGSRVYCMTTGAYSWETVFSVSEVSGGVPQLLGSIVAEFNATIAAAKRTVALVSQPGTTVRIVDVTNGVNPEIVGTFSSPFVRNLALEGDRLFVANADRFAIYDIANPASPIALETVPIVLYPLCVSNGFVFAGVYGEQARLVVIDARTPGASVVADEVLGAGTISDIDVRDGLAVIFATVTGSPSTKSVYILDVSRPASPEVRGSIKSLASTFSAAELMGKFLYLGREYVGIDVYDLKDPATPRYVGCTATPTWVKSFASSDRFLFVLERWSHLLAFPGACVNGPSDPPDFASLTAESIPLMHEQPVGAILSFGPNPVRSIADVRLDVGAPKQVRLTIFDLTGRRVATLLDRAIAAGETSLSWDTNDSFGDPVGSGVYFLRGEFPDSPPLMRKLVVAR